MVLIQNFMSWFIEESCYDIVIKISLFATLCDHLVNPHWAFAR